MMYATFILSMLLGAITTLLGVIAYNLMRLRSDIGYLHSEIARWMVEQHERAHYR